jgi:hypothetical protein
LAGIKASRVGQGGLGLLSLFVLFLGMVIVWSWRGGVTRVTSNSQQCRSQKKGKIINNTSSVRLLWTKTPTCNKFRENLIKG